MRDITRPLSPEAQRRSLIRSAILRGVASVVLFAFLIAMLATGRGNTLLLVSIGGLLFFEVGYFTWALQQLRRLSRAQD